MGSTEVEIFWVSPEALVPNPWNANEMDEEQYQRALTSIDTFGFIDPITARLAANDRWEIIDGEHRWRAAKQRALPTVPIVVIEATDAEAKQLSIILNEVRGQPNPEKLGLLLKDLLATETKEALLDRLPYSRDAFDRLTGLPPLSWGDMPTLDNKPTERSTWVERTYRMPRDAAQVVDQAIARCREIESSEDPDWHLLELVCADFLGS